MTRLDSIRSKLSQKVFNDSIGTDVTITPVSVGSSPDGGFTIVNDTDGTPVVVKGVPFSMTNQRLFKEMFGEAPLGESSVLVPYDTVVSVGDKVSWLSKEYRVEAVEDFVLGGGVVAKQLLVNERLSS